MVVTQWKHFTCGTPDSAMILSFSLFSCTTFSGIDDFRPTREVSISGGSFAKRTGNSSRPWLVASFSSLICGEFSTTPAKCPILNKRIEKGISFNAGNGVANGLCARLRIELSCFGFWSGSWCCDLGQVTLIPNCLFTQVYKCVPANFKFECSR